MALTGNRDHICSSHLPFKNIKLANDYYLVQKTNSSSIKEAQGIPQVYIEKITEGAHTENRDSLKKAYVQFQKGIDRGIHPFSRNSTRIRQTEQYVDFQNYHSAYEAPLSLQNSIPRSNLLVNLPQGQRFGRLGRALQNQDFMCEGRLSLTTAE